MKKAVGLAPTAFAFTRKGGLVAALALRLFGVLLALLVAATTTTLIALGLSAALATALVELLDAAGGTTWSSRTARTASAKVLLLALAPAALIVLAVALFELVGTTRSTGCAKVLLLALATAALIGIIAVALFEPVDFAWRTSRTAGRAEVLLLALTGAALVEIIAVALLELIGASRSARRAKVLLLVLVAVFPTVVAIAPTVSGFNLARGTSSGRRTVFQDRRRQLRRLRAAVSLGLIFITALVPIAVLALVVDRTLVADDLPDRWRLRALGLIFLPIAIPVLAAVAEIATVEVVLLFEGVGILLGD